MTVQIRDVCGTSTSRGHYFPIDAPESGIGINPRMNHDARRTSTVPLTLARGIYTLEVFTPLAWLGLVARTTDHLTVSLPFIFNIGFN